MFTYVAINGFATIVMQYNGFQVVAFFVYFCLDVNGCTIVPNYITNINIRESRIYVSFNWMIYNLYKVSRLCVFTDVIH